MNSDLQNLIIVIIIIKITITCISNKNSNNINKIKIMETIIKVKIKILVEGITMDIHFLNNNNRKNKFNMKLIDRKDTYYICPIYIIFFEQY